MLLRTRDREKDREREKNRHIINENAVSTSLTFETYMHICLFGLVWLGLVYDCFACNACLYEDNVFFGHSGK